MSGSYPCGVCAQAGDGIWINGFFTSNLVPSSSISSFACFLALHCCTSCVTTVKHAIHDTSISTQHPEPPGEHSDKEVSRSSKSFSEHGQSRPLSGKTPRAGCPLAGLYSSHAIKQLPVGGVAQKVCSALAWSTSWVPLKLRPPVGGAAHRRTRAHCNPAGQKQPRWVPLKLQPPVGSAAHK